MDLEEIMQRVGAEDDLREENQDFLVVGETPLLKKGLKDAHLQILGGSFSAVSKPIFPGK